MDKTRSDRVRDICSLVQTEQDQQKFLKLIQELNRILAGEEEEVGTKPPDPGQ